MATTKELLEKTILRLGSRGSRGAGNTVSLAVDQDSTDFQNFVASADGFVKAYGTSSAWQASQVTIKGNSGYVIQPPRSSGVTVITWLPVMKGETFSVSFYAVTSRTIVFLKSIGGGLKALAETLERGGAIWLRLRVFSKLQSLRSRCGNLRRSGRGLTSPRQYPTQNGTNRLTTIRHRMGSLFTEHRCVRTRSSEEAVRACRNGGFLFKTQTEETKSFLCRRGKECLSGVVALIQTPLTHTFSPQPSILSHDYLALQGGI